jgi:hypothetical protein
MLSMLKLNHHYCVHNRLLLTALWSRSHQLLVKLLSEEGRYVTTKDVTEPNRFSMYCLYDSHNLHS